jgi:uncharacterized protein
MSLIRKVRKVLDLFKELDNEISVFKVESGIECKTGCGECCLYPKVHATILEFLPFAYKMIIEGKAIDLLEKLKIEDAYSFNCIIYSPLSLPSHKGHCSDYENRGLICRLFGYSANLKKDGTPGMITCKIIKTNHSEFFKNSESLSEYSKHLPIASEYYSKLQSIDLTLSLTTYPINIAIRKALEYGLSYYAYRKYPKYNTDNKPLTNS